jgi:hypothetical protein
MDVFEGPSMGSGEPEQLHDFNPDDLNEPGLPDLFSAGGVFWTSSVPERAVGVHSGRGDARFRLQD